MKQNWDFAFVLALALAVVLYVGGALVGCKGTGESIPVTFEACFIQEGIGKVCAAYSAERGLFISADISGSPELQDKIFTWAEKLGWKRPPVSVDAVK